MSVALANIVSTQELDVFRTSKSFEEFSSFFGEAVTAFGNCCFECVGGDVCVIGSENSFPSAIDLRGLFLGDGTVNGDDVGYGEGKGEGKGEREGKGD